MDENQIPKKKLFICKFCNKKYPCGKSLGGHIRIHLNGNGSGHGNGIAIGNENSSDAEDEADLKLNTIKTFGAAVSGSNSKKDSDTEAAGQSAAYGLRENPKKTRRFMADSNQRKLLEEKVCKECGKGFQSLKALCGHMACHSKTGFEDQSETTEKLKDQVFDSQSDTETSSAPSKRRRSTRMRYNKTIDVYSSSSLSLANASVSSASDNAEQEEEEVAMCLMMLSKDSGFKGCFTSVADYSDNNSVYVETRSSPKLRISVKNNGINCVLNANEILDTKKSKQQQQTNGNGDFKNSDSGYFRHGLKKIEPEISVHDELKQQKLGYGCSRYEEEFNPEMSKRLSRFRRIKTELGKDINETETVRRKRGKHNDFYIKEIPSKTGKCLSVEGNRRNYRANGCSESIYEIGENSIEKERVPNRKTIRSCDGKSPIVQISEQKQGLKKGKVHECPFCYKVFRSGQALGGHKRSHFVGGSEDRTVVIDHQVPQLSMSGTLIDLNLPAPMEEDTNGYYLASW